MTGSETELSYYGCLNSEEWFQPGDNGHQKGKCHVSDQLAFGKGVVNHLWEPSLCLLHSQVIHYKDVDNWKNKLPAPFLLWLYDTMWEIMHDNEVTMNDVLKLQYAFCYSHHQKRRDPEEKRKRVFKARNGTDESRDAGGSGGASGIMVRLLRYSVQL